MANLDLFKPPQEIRELNLLQELEKNPIVSQRNLSHKFGIALGVTNACLKRMARRGWILRVKFIKKNLNLSWKPVLIFSTITGIFVIVYRPGLILTHEIFWERILITLIIVAFVVTIGYRMFRQFILSGWHPMWHLENQR